MQRMIEVQVLYPEQYDLWMSVLEQTFQYDFYHLPSYHALAEEFGEGKAHLFVYSEESYTITVPLLLRSVGEVPGLTHSGEGWRDATSVYGYAGPIASHTDIPAMVLRNFHGTLYEHLKERNVVSVFSRLHPLVDQKWMLSGLGEYKPIGRTVSIDLTLPIDVQRALYRRDHKNDINKLRRLGVTCLHDQDKMYLNDFVDIYHETMCRVNASPEYFFDPIYFEKLISKLDSNFHLFVCLLQNKVICAGSYTLCDGIVQGFLGGSRNEFSRLSPMRLLTDSVRLWANECGEHVFHLGGGVGGREDSLFHFKAGFSNQRHQFAVWNWILFPKVYNQLCEEKNYWNKQHGLEPASDKYFPAYRCPTIPVRL